LRFVCGRSRVTRRELLRRFSVHYLDLDRMGCCR
jgi:hypothetical protein